MHEGRFGADALRLYRAGLRSAVAILEMQNGLLYPIAHGIDADDRCVFVGSYVIDTELEPMGALVLLRRTLAKRAFRSSVIVYGVELPHHGGRNALCVDFASLDARPETVYVPFVITRPWLRSARVITYAPIPAAELAITRTPPSEKEL